MTDNEIIKEATEAVEKGLPCAFLVKPLLEVAKSQKEEINILIRKKEALRDEIADKQAEIERLKTMHSEMCIGMKRLKSEAYREFAEHLGRDEYGQYDWEYKSIIYTQDEIDTTLEELTRNSHGKQ